MHRDRNRSQVEGSGTSVGSANSRSGSGYTVDPGEKLGRIQRICFVHAKILLSEPSSKKRTEEQKGSRSWRGEE